MTLLAVAGSSSQLPFPRDMSFQPNSRRDFMSTHDKERIELPPIRFLVPNIQYPTSRDESRYGGDLLPYSSASGPASPNRNKRRRLSEDGIQTEGRENDLPRLYRSSPRQEQRSQSATVSPVSSSRRGSIFSKAESWSDAARNTSYSAGGYHTPRSPPSLESSTLTRKLPSLPAIFNSTTPRNPSSFTEYALESSRAQTYPQVQTSGFEPSISTYQPSFSYGYQQPRGSSYSGNSSYGLPHDRSPFSSSHTIYSGSAYSYGGDGSDGSDNKQRKRRGNLPKETTDKLRAWFVAHLQHPYPTEDEKQELMRQTGLQMNQISNWFINARRRQLPAMINNARAEQSARTGEGLLGDNTSEQGDESRRRSPMASPSRRLGDSDGEGSAYDEDYNIHRARNARGSV